MRYTKEESKQWKQGLWQRGLLYGQHRGKKAPDPEEVHKGHPQEVRMNYTGGHAVWCKTCKEKIVDLTDEEYKIYKELFPSVIRRAAK
jgi:hypothetical protein